MTTSGLDRTRKVFGRGLTFLCGLAIAWLVGMCGFGGVAWADEATGIAGPAASDAAAASTATPVADVEVSAEGDEALADGADFAIADFVRAQSGTNLTAEDGAYLGYGYYQGSSADYVVAIALADTVIVYVPPESHELITVEDADACASLKAYLLALDAQSLGGGVFMSGDERWIFTSDGTYRTESAVYRFADEVKPGRYYLVVTGLSGEDVASTAGGAQTAARPTHVEFAQIVTPDAVAIQPKAEGMAALGEFFANVDWSPLWVTLRTTFTAIVFIFILGLAAAYFTLRLPKRGQDVFDTIFTIPMVLPPTVCGFLLLLALGRNSVVGQWFIDIGLPLAFSWPATVVAAVVVAFPLMYRTARGAFENLDRRMLDAARTLGWSEGRIFFSLMLPLAWSSIAAGTVLSFARALGEFGATLFLAGNYAGITQTIPIAIYFEWIGGDMASALFWTIVVLIFSFIVILFVNLWGRRTTKYRKALSE